jgi:uncharacterized protein (TIGR03437 family)
LFLRRARAAALRRFPYVQNLSSTSVTVLWTTDSPAEGEVRYSTDLGFSVSAPSRATELTAAQTGLDASYWRHRAVLRNLDPGSRYNYQVWIDGQPISTAFSLNFHTPAGTGPFTFLVLGDSGAQTQEQLTLRDRMMEESPALVLHTGDLAYPVGSFESFQKNYLDVYRDLMWRVPFFPCPGNHGYMTAEAFPHLSVHDLPANDIPSDLGRYYSFDWCGCHFVALDSNAPLSAATRGTGPMLKWLDADLRKANNRFWKIVYFHHPPYGFGPNELDPLTALAREHIVPILERHGVQLVLNGHEHSYQRSYSIRNGAITEPDRGTTYITSGGGGNGLYPVYANPLVTQGHSRHHYLRVRVEQTRLAIEAVDVRGEVFDSVNLAPLPEFNAATTSSLNAVSGAFAPNGVISIYGSSLARRAQPADPQNPGEELAGITVTAADRPARILYASPSQINAILPADLSGDIVLRVHNLNGETATALRISPSAPGILTVAHEDGSLVTPEAPARSNEMLTLHTAGLGASKTVAVELDDNSVNSELSDGLYAGLHQIRFRIPSTLTGKIGLRIRAGDSLSPLTVIDVA